MWVIYPSKSTLILQKTILYHKMTKGLLTEGFRKTFELRTVARFAITFVILSMVISSPVFMLVNPAQVSAASVNDNSKRIDSSGYHSTPSIPGPFASPLSSPTPMVPAATNQGSGDFTTQAALSGVWTRQTNNIVGSQSYYDVVFVTSTTGTIKFIDITFPPGIVIGAPINLAEREGIGAGSAEKTSATQIRYTVTSAVSVAEGTKIRLEFFNIVNPTAPSTGYKVTVTTRNAAGTVIDGPTTSNGFSIKQMSTSQIADGAVTTGKIASDAITPSASSLYAGLVSVPPSDTASGTALCPSDRRVIGGVFSVSPASAPFLREVHGQIDVINNGYETTMYNDDPVNPHTFSPGVNCMHPMP